ncbi:MAG: response regulator transcription factor [Lewinella sp.]|nr:response regulator transcription factor [Lewinella sp.]
MINILITDDHQLVIDGLQLMLSSETDLHCVATATDGAQALAVLARQSIDVILLDINMPGTNGVEACKRIHQDFPEVKILILSMLKEASLIKLLLRSGATGYLLKNAGKDEVIRAIRTVYRGERYYSPEVADIVMLSLAGDTSGATTSPFPSLSRREKQVLKLIVDEHTTAEIADKLFISFGTVETHRRNLLIKLGARNTAGLVRTALEYGLLE